MNHCLYISVGINGVIMVFKTVTAFEIKKYIV